MSSVGWKLWGEKPSPTDQKPVRGDGERERTLEDEYLRSMGIVDEIVKVGMDGGKPRRLKMPCFADPCLGR